MTNSISSNDHDEAGTTTSPQLRDSTVNASGPATQPAWLSMFDGGSEGAGRRFGLAPSLTPVIRSLAEQLLASEARALAAERRLAGHGRHCICRAAEIAADEDSAMQAVAVTGSPVDCDTDSLSLAA